MFTLSTDFGPSDNLFGHERTYGHTAQIEAIGLFYQNQAAKSVEKCGIVQKINLKFRHHPQNPNFFWKIFLNFLRIKSFGPQGLDLIIL